MPAGKYRTAITVERNQATTTKGGSAVNNWSQWLERRCKLRVASVRDQMPAPETQNAVLISHVIELRRDSQTELIQQDMRVRVFSRRPNGVARILHIESVVEADERGSELVLRCVERGIDK
jgi:head-tail adaptor